MTKPTIFSGIKPSGDLHLGNYLGALTQWKELQEEYNSIFCVVDLHAITVKQEPELLRKRIIEITKHFLASGVDPKKAIIFQQSSMYEHSELAWILNTQSRMSDLFRMTQFKDKSGVQFDLEEFEKGLKDQSKSLTLPIETQNKIINHIGPFENSTVLKLIEESAKAALESANFLYKQTLSGINKTGVGLFDYPVLMAADILLYQTDIVPVGEDQVQHVELTRDLGKRFNNTFGEVFKIPKSVVKKEGARIMGLDDPTKKMGKSDTSTANYIAMLDEPTVAAKKIMRATTDTGKEIIYDKENKPGISNLLTIYSILTNKPIKQLEKDYEGRGYGDFKKDLAEVVKDFLTSYQQRYNSYTDQQIKDLLKEGAEKLKPIAQKTLSQVKQKVGFSI